MDLRLSLKRKWFEMTAAGIKGEDYRNITPYWVTRFIYHKESKLTIQEIIRFINNYEYYGYVDTPTMFIYHDILFKQFDHNIMTLGYPSHDQTDRIIKFKHAGIEIGYGKPEWGAEPNKLYFIVKHGERIS